MFLTLNHQKLEIYKATRQLVAEAYRLTRILLPEEKYGMVQQIRRAALSVHLNVAEGASRRSDLERKRFFEIARGSIIEIDAALDVACELEYIKKECAIRVGEIIVKCFRLLSGLIGSK